VILLKLELKLALKAMPKFLISGIILFLIIGGLAIGADGVLGRNRKEEAPAKFSVAVVSKEDTMVMDYAKSIVLSTKSINSSVNLIFTSEKEGINLLDDNKAIALMVIPEQVVDDIISGVNNPIKIKFPENPGYEAAVFREIAESAVSMLSASQAGVYSAYDFYGEEDEEDSIDAAKKRLNGKYIKSVLLRESIYDDVLVVATEELTVIEYYIISGIIVFFLLFGINYISFTNRFPKEIYIRLMQNKISPVFQIISKINALFVVYFILFLAGLTVVLFVHPINFLMVLKMILGIIPVIFSIASIVIFIFQVFVNKISSIVFLFLYTIIQGFLTGCIIPKTMLSDAVVKASEYTPGYYFVEQIRMIFIGSGNLFLNTIIIILIGLFFTYLASRTLVRGGRYD